MKKTPTAEEFLQQRDCIRNVEDFYNDVQPIDLIEFAKLHVEAALKEVFLNSEMRVSENDTNEYPSFTNNYDDGYVTITVSKDSILNSYPLDKIK